MSRICSSSILLVVEVHVVLASLRELPCGQQQLDEQLVLFLSCVEIIDVSYFPRPRAYSSTGGELSKVNSRYLQNIRYLRFKNLTVGYTLPSKWTRKVGLEKTRFYFSGENLAYWSPLAKYTKYLDPESAYRRNTSESAAQDHMSYPWQRTLMFGIDITF